jgi:hypothetical protein
MKTQTSIAKKRVVHRTSRPQSGRPGINLPRLFLFLEVFVEKEIPGRSTK